MNNLEKSWLHAKQSGSKAPAQEEYARVDELPGLRISKLTFLLIFATAAALAALVIPNVVGMLKG
jgi:hypothetical protein